MLCVAGSYGILNKETIEHVMYKEVQAMDQRTSEGMGMGLCIGVALSVALGFQIAYGAVLGMLAGAAIGYQRGKK